MKKSQRKRFAIFSIVAFIVSLLSAILITYPLLFHLGSQATGIGDELVIAWIQNWVIHSLFTNPLTIFQANIYYPYNNTLAFSDVHITSSVIAIPIKLLIGEPISTFNFTVIFSIFSVGFSIAVLCYYLTRNFFASLFSAILVMYSPAFLDKKVHVQILGVEWAIFSVLFYLVFINTKKTKYLLLTALFFLLQMYNSFLPGYFVIFSILIITLHHLIINKKKTYDLITKKHLLMIFVTFSVTLPVIIPYYQVSKEFNYTRDIRDAVHLAFQFEDFFYPSEHTRLKEVLRDLPFNKNSQNDEYQPGYLGIVFSALVAISVIYLIRKFKKKNIIINSFSAIALLGFVLSLGPVLHLGRQTVHVPFLIPLPYAIFYYVVPGFQGFRNAARWEMLFIIAMAVVIAYVLNDLFKKYSNTKNVFIYVCLVFIVLIELKFPMKFYPIPQREEFPKVYSWLHEIPTDSSVIEMPIYNWNSTLFVQQEIWRQYYGTEHFRRTVNGYTGFSPPPWQSFIATMDNDFPDKKALQDIKIIGVDYIIVHKELFDEGFKAKKQKYTGERILTLLNNNPSLVKIKQIDSISVYTFRNK